MKNNFLYLKLILIIGILLLSTNAIAQESTNNNPMMDLTIRIIGFLLIEIILIFPLLFFHHFGLYRLLLTNHYLPSMARKHCSSLTFLYSIINFMVFFYNDVNDALWKMLFILLLVIWLAYTIITFLMK